MARQQLTNSNKPKLIPYAGQEKSSGKSPGRPKKINRDPYLDGITNRTPGGKVSKSNGRPVVSATVSNGHAKRGRPVKVAPEIPRDIKLFVAGCDSLDDRLYFRKVSTEAQFDIAKQAIKMGLMEKGVTAQGKKIATLTQSGKKLFEKIKAATD